MMKKELHSRIIASIPLGYAYYQVLIDDKGLPYDYELVEINDNGRKLMGNIKGQIIGQKLFQSMGKMIKNNKLMIDALNKVALGGDEQTVDNLRFGDKIIRMKVISPEKGFIATYFTDMTEDIKKQEETEALLSVLNDIIFIIDSQFVFKDILTNDESLLFVPKKQIIGCSIHEIFDEMATKFFLDAMNKARKSGKEETLVYPSVNPNENKWFSASIQILGKGDELRYVIAISDITEKKNFELNLMNEKENLEKQKELQNAIFDIFSTFTQTKVEVYRILIERSLEKIGQILNNDRTFVFHYDMEKMTAKPIYIWLSPKYEYSVIELNEVPMKAFDKWNKAHMNGESIYIDDVSKIPDGDIKNELVKQSLKSFFTMPMISNDYCYGFIGFESIKETKIYTDEERLLLSKYAQILLAFIQRIDNENKLKAVKDEIKNYFK